MPRPSRSVSGTSLSGSAWLWVVLPVALCAGGCGGAGSAPAPEVVAAVDTHVGTDDLHVPDAADAPDDAAPADAAPADAAPAEDGGPRDVASPDAGSPPSTGAHTIEVDGLVRRYLLDVPAGLPPRAPLVLVFHGYGDDAAGVRDYTGFAALAEENGFVAAYPEGTEDEEGDQFFNVGYDINVGSRVDDVAFARALASRLVEALDLDPAAVFVTGMSNGADMSYLVACDEATWVRAIAAVAGSMMTDNVAGCAPSGRVSVMEVHGTEDEETRWAGDPMNRDGWGAYLGTEETVDFWVQRLALERSETSDLPDLDPDDGSDVQLLRWSTVADDAEVRLYRVEGGGHDWPGSWGNGDIDASSEVWRFFAAHLDR